jgi:long-chain fatty acid transport protein
MPSTDRRGHFLFSDAATIEDTMPGITRLYLALSLCAALVGLPAAVGATDGYFTLGTGPIRDGSAGAGVALPKDSSIAAANPAGLVRVGNRWEIGAALFAPYRQYTVDGAPSRATGTFGLAPGAVKSLDDNFLLPATAA